MWMLYGQFGNLLDRWTAAGDGDPPQPHESKGARWFWDSPPAFDPVSQVREFVPPVLGNPEWNSEELTYSVRPKSPDERLAELAAAITERLAAAEMYHDVVTTGGVRYDFGEGLGVLTIQTRKAPYDDRDYLMTAMQVAAYYVQGIFPGAGADEPMNPLRVAENVNVPLSAGDMLLLVAGVQSKLGAYKVRLFAIKDAIAAAADLEALAAIDVEDGYPSSLIAA